MRPRSWISLFVCVLATPALFGCQAHYPYGQAGYPGYYGAPPPTYGPATGITPTPAGPGAQMFDSKSGVWQQSAQPEPAGNSSNAPPFNPEDDVNSGTQSNKYVPDYPDADNINAPDIVRDDEEGEGTITSPFRKSGDASTDLDEVDDETASENPFDEQTRNRFVAPLHIQPVSATRVVDDSTAMHGPNPYDYDRVGYRWMRGIVEYDRKDKSWHLMYSIKPSENDKLGGDISLMSDPKLRTLHDDDVVIVEGHIETESRDRYGKPRYHIDHLVRLTPKQGHE